jgi:hypothetical protein
LQWESLPVLQKKDWGFDIRMQGGEGVWDVLEDQNLPLNQTNCYGYAEFMIHHKSAAILS